MNTYSRSLCLTLSPSHALLLLTLAGLPATADTSFNATGYLAAVPLPGITCTNSGDQVHLKGNVHVVRLESTEPRANGRLQAWMDLAYQADSTAIFRGPAYIELGTWDTYGTNFTPSGGVWAVNYSGSVLADGSSQYGMTGYGVCGSIENSRFTATVTRANPSAPYLASGTIKAKPLNNSVVVDNFDNNHFDTPPWNASGAGVGTLYLLEANTQLTLGATYSTETLNVMDHTAWVWADRSWVTTSSLTAEARVDLASLGPAATGANVALYHSSANQGYGFQKGTDWISLWKANGSIMTCFSCRRVTTPNTNVVLTLSLTFVGQNLVLTGKVLDKSGNVLAQLTYVDTPAADPALSAEALAALTGGRVMHDIGPDLEGAPWKDGTSMALLVHQDTDGTLPRAEATFDNVELHVYEVPRIGLERAIRLSWPATGMNFGIEGAPAVEGPWLPVPNSDLPGMQLYSVPASEPMKFFRLQQAP